MSDLSWTSYESDNGSAPAVPQLPAPQVQSRQEQYSPEQLQVLLKGGSGSAPETKPKEVSDSSKDISNFNTVSDLIYICIAVLTVDVVVIFLTRFYPEIFGRNLNRWYDLFGLNAVLADVLIIVLGFVIARYIYTWAISPKIGWNPWAFTGTVVGTQFVHDILFYLGVISPIPKGHNLMMDVFKDYAASGGAKILFGDGLMMVASCGLAMALKTSPAHIVASFGLLVSYALPYVLYTRNMFTVLR